MCATREGGGNGVWNIMWFSFHFSFFSSDYLFCLVSPTPVLRFFLPPCLPLRWLTRCIFISPFPFLELCKVIYKVGNGYTRAVRSIWDF